MVALMTQEEIQQRLAKVRGDHLDLVKDEQDKTEYRYVRPFHSTYGSIMEALENPDSRIMLGLPAIDVMTRGFGAKELVFISGFAHSGKTQIVNTMIKENLDKRILFFSMDDPAEMILLKLACMTAGYSADVLERRIRQGDETAKVELKTAAVDTFKNLIVVDESLGLSAMTKAVREATTYWGAPPECIIIDYLELMQGNSFSDDASANVKAKSQSLKRWVKDQDAPVIVVHQATRSKGAPGQAITMMSMAYGGEQEATMVIGVRRKRDDEKLDSFERQRVQDTLTLHLAKNKRPPARVTAPEGIDFYMDPDTGLVRPLRDNDIRSGQMTIDDGTITKADDALRLAQDRARAAGLNV
jgi:replicative DNA helicase